MPTPKKGRRLGGSPAHQRHILANLATALFEHGAVTTTEAKARALRPFAEKLITKAKKGDLASRRAVNAVIRKERIPGTPRLDNSVQYKLHTEIAEMFKDRPGGYTRITKIGPRKGDNAPMAVIELVTEEYQPKAAAPAPAAPVGTAAPVEVSQDADEAPAEVEATDESGETQVLSTEATDVETAEAESAAEETTEAAEAPAEESSEDEADKA